MEHLDILSGKTGVKSYTISKVVDLLEGGATVPFIARYRKEATGSLDEVSILNIQSELKKLKDLISRKETILNTIAEQGLLDEELKSKINDCWEGNKLEDLYLPYKKKKRTKATIARENGLEGLAKIIMSQREADILNKAHRFLFENVASVEDAISGACHIIAEWINENPTVRDIIRRIFERNAWLYAKVKKDKKEDGQKFKDYFNYEGLLKKVPSHRMLAILRGESEDILKVKVDIETEEAQKKLERFFIKMHSDSEKYIKAAIEDSLKRMILPSIRNEFLSLYKEKADDEAIKVFARNAEELLLSPPLGSKKILGIDPGYRTGCKVISIDSFGNLQHSTTIYPHPPQNNSTESEKIIRDLFQKFKVEAIAIGNGTAGLETYHWIKLLKICEPEVIFLVNEDGASIYSASEIAREEFPDKDITVRGAVSIARRLMDPLAELVKIDPKSIGVGQYQHDVNQKKLRESLTDTVISCVNRVGINLNTASKHLLGYVSGLGPGLAENIVNYREEKGKFNAIKELKKVPRLGEKAFEQCAGFLRVKNGKNPLDNTGVHPEAYNVVNHILNDLNIKIEEVAGNENILNSINLENYVSDQFGIPTLQDIIKELKKPGLDPRSKAKAVTFDENIKSIEDLKTGQILNGIVTNITNFGAFVDLGIKESALLHISQIADQYISDPSEILSLNQEVKVKVIEVDISRKRISVSMKVV